MSREAMLAASALPTQAEPFDAPVWGPVHLRYLTGADFERYLEADQASSSANDRLARLCVLAVCDETGAPLFQPGDHVALLEGKMAPVIACGARLTEINHLREMFGDSGN